VQRGRIFHLFAEGWARPEYWRHFELPARATLRDVDDFLRETWLECCGHLSAFTIDGQSYMPSADRELDARGMNISLEKVLYPGVKFRHEYDFGTTTELALRLIGEREGEVRGRAVRILARNAAPEFQCEDCGATATQVCTECLWEGEGWLCDQCAPEHACGEEMCLPVVNSPRMGMCGYTG
jgi:predicted RNA-binding Zn-ribbon protein involved in translation (DUF1610 family)